MGRLMRGGAGEGRGGRWGGVDQRVDGSRPDLLGGGHIGPESWERPNEEY
jgi:hypothetical protein